MALEIFTGPRAKFTIDGTVVALGRSITVMDDYRYEPVEVLNNIEVLGHEPVGYTCSMRCQQILQVGQTLEDLGFKAKKGSSPQDHLANLLALPAMVGQVEDDPSDTIVRRVFGVKLASDDFSVDARGMASGDISFVATRSKSASEAT